MDILLKSGTKKKPWYIKIHEIKLTQDILNDVPPFYAITGNDTTS